MEPQAASRDFIWTGAVLNLPDSHAVMIVGEDGSMTGNIARGDGRMFQVRTTEDGVVWVLEIDQKERAG